MRTPLAALFLILLLFLDSTLFAAGEIAVIVNNENPLDEISSGDLVKIFKQEKQQWNDGRQVYLIMQEAGSREKEVMLKKVFKMSHEELKKFWMAQMFRGKISSFPKTLSSNAAVKRFVNQVVVAIGFIDASIVDQSVKVLSIDGKLPGEKGYLLTD
jgi:ABC-type phosphate transport system substrate-binding protein